MEYLIIIKLNALIVNINKKIAVTVNKSARNVKKNGGKKLIFSIKCKNCGHYQIKQTNNLSNAVFKCNRCEKSYHIYGATGWNVDYKEHYNTKVAVGYCMDKNGAK